MPWIQRRFIRTAAEVGTWMSDNIPHKTVDAISYPCSNPRQSLLANEALVVSPHRHLAQSWLGSRQRFGLRHAWWRHQMETFSALLAICAGNSPVTGEFTAQRPVTRSLDIFFDLRLNKRLSKQQWGWWFQTLSRPLWRHCNGMLYQVHHCQEFLQTSNFHTIWSGRNYIALHLMWSWQTLRPNMCVSRIKVAKMNDIRICIKGKDVLMCVTIINFAWTG